MIFDSLLRLADDSLQLAFAATGQKLTASVPITSMAEVGKGQPLFLRIAPSRVMLPIGATASSIIFQLRGSESPLLFTDANTAITPNTPAGGFTKAGHGLLAGTPVFFTGTIGGITNNTIYHVTAGATLLTDSFSVSDTRANALAGTGIVASSSAGTSPTITQVSRVLTQALSQEAVAASPAATSPFAISTSLFISTAFQQARPIYAPIHPVADWAGQPGSANTIPAAGNPGVRYLTGSLACTLSGTAPTDLRFSIDVVNAIDTSRTYYPVGTPRLF